MSRAIDNLKVKGTADAVWNFNVTDMPMYLKVLILFHGEHVVRSDIITRADFNTYMSNQGFRILAWQYLPKELQGFV